MANTPTSNDFSYYSGSLWLEGGTTYLFPSSSRLKAGIDLREIYSVTHGGGNAGFVSLRVAFAPRHNLLSSYFQIGGDYIHVPLSYQSSVTGGAADLVFGLNVRASEQWTIRAIELEHYAGSRVALSTLGAGVVYTLPER